MPMADVLEKDLVEKAARELEQIRGQCSDLLAARERGNVEDMRVWADDHRIDDLLAIIDRLAPKPQ